MDPEAKRRRLLAKTELAPAAAAPVPSGLSAVLASSPMNLGVVADHELVMMRRAGDVGSGGGAAQPLPALLGDGLGFHFFLSHYQAKGSSFDLDSSVRCW